MKIGLVCPYNIYKGGGVQEVVFALQAELSRRGHEALIVTPQPRELPDEIQPFVRLLGRARDVKSPFQKTTAQISVRVDNKQVMQLLDEEQFDVLHFHEPWVPFLSWQMLQRSTAKNVATFHAKLPDTVMSRTIERVITPYTKAVLKHPNLLTAVSEAGAEYARSLTDQEIKIIPNGIDLTKYRVGKPAKDAYVFYVGRLEGRKGLKYLLKAMAVQQRGQKPLKLVIAGDGPDRQRLTHYANDQGVDVEFLGRVSDSEKLRLLRAATVFCSPALYGESFGIVLLEAMACGVPVVAGDNPGYSAVLHDTGQLSLVNPKETANFVRTLELMAYNDELREMWRTWALETVKQYNYPIIVDAYEHLYAA